VAAGDVSTQIEIAESEPWPTDAVSSQFGTHPFGLANAAPPAHFVIRPREGVHDRVEIGRDAKATQPHVIPGVDHCGDLRGGAPHSIGPGFAKVVTQSAKKTCATNSAREYGNFHVANANRPKADQPDVTGHLNAGSMLSEYSLHSD
jgi:hypothetical protein